MMLDFYGIKMLDREIGKLERSDKYEPRYKNLVKYYSQIIELNFFLFKFF